MKNIIANQVDSLFIFIVAISVFFLLLVTGFMIYFVFRYSKKRNPKSSDITGNTTLEVLWTVIPTILVLAIFYYGLIGFDVMRNPPPDSFVVKVTARMWMWSFEYPNGKKTDTLLYVPVGKPVKFDINSVDVNHSFFVPAFRVKEDAIPGRTNYMWFLPNEVGEYWIECAEYCGMGHSFMRGKVIVMSTDDFYKWYNAPPPDTTKTVTGLIPDSLKIKTDSLKLKPDTLKVKTDTLKTKSNSLKIPKDTSKFKKN
jgi:cytochrome c oxidase subunit 2